MSGGGAVPSRIEMICDELARYGISAAPSAERPSWLVVHTPSSAFSDPSPLWSRPVAPEVYVSDEELLRADCIEVVLGKVTSVVGHPC